MRPRQRTAFLSVALLSLLVLGAALAVSVQDCAAGRHAAAERGYDGIPSPHSPCYVSFC